MLYYYYSGLSIKISAILFVYCIDKHIKFSNYCSNFVDRLINIKVFFKQKISFVFEFGV